MPGLVPGIHVFEAAKEGVDGRDKPGHDGKKTAHAPSVPRRHPSGISRLPLSRWPARFGLAQFAPLKK